MVFGFVRAEPQTDSPVLDGAHRLEALLKLLEDQLEARRVVDLGLRDLGADAAEQLLVERLGRQRCELEFVEVHHVRRVSRGRR